MAVERPILIVDGDGNLRQTLKMHLEFGGRFVVTTVGTLVDAAQKLWSRDTRYDAVIIDVGLPDGDGCDFCARLRQRGEVMPMILISEHGDEDGVVRGLTAGANDYLVKPIRIAEFQARLRAHLRTYDDSQHALFAIGRFLFRPADKLLCDRTSHRRIRLTSKETAMLKCLYRAGTNMVSRDDLINEVWGYRAKVSAHTLETHVYRLRHKLELDPRDPCILLTGRGGYRLDPHPRSDGANAA